MEAAPRDIENAEAPTNVFGYWPSFHDAEVVTISLYRPAASTSREPVVLLADRAEG